MHQKDLTAPATELLLDPAILAQTEQGNPESRLALQLELARLGLVTLQTNGKVPVTNHGVKDATADPELIEQRHRRNPNHNIALATGYIVTIDVDVKNGAPGLASLAALESDHGPLPDTLRVRTPSGGLHLHFLASEPLSNRVGFRPGIDCRGDGGIIVLPGSVLDGVPYVAENPGTSIKPLPASLAAEIKGARKRLTLPRHRPSPRVATSQVTGFPKGMRNDGIFRLAASLRGKDVPYEMALADILAAAAACEPPLPEAEAVRCLRSAYESYRPNGYRPPLTDLGNAECFVSAVGDICRYINGYDCWYVREESFWRPSDKGEVQQLAKAVLRDRKQETTNAEHMGTLSKFVASCEKRARLDDLLILASREPGMTIHANDLDADDHLFGVQNGVLDLNTGQLVTPGPDQYITKQGGTAFDPQATCPRWRRFIEEIAAGDPAWVRFTQTLLGYLLMGGNPEQKFVILNGAGANGKSTLMAIISTLLGGYGLTVEPAIFMLRRQMNAGGLSEHVVRLRGARIVWTSEVSEGELLNEDFVKRSSGGDLLTGRAVYARHTIEFLPRFVALMATNHLPIIKGDDHAIWRRILVLPFNRIFTEPEQDKELIQKLLAELPGILNWCLEGLALYRQEGLVVPASIQAAGAEYREDMDLLADWMTQQCVLDPQATSSTGPLFNDYMRFNADDTVSQRLSVRAFGRKLKDHGFAACKVNGQRAWRGIRLKTEPEKYARVAALCQEVRNR